MRVDEIFVIISGIAGVALVYWFFLMKNTQAVVATDSLDIIVEGGYTPETISLPLGKTIKLNFLRKDPSSCLEEVVLPDFRVRKYLPLNQKVSIELMPKKTGEFPFSCGMNMFHGKIIVSEKNDKAIKH